MGFLLLNIFLGLLGTFWFRTQQRRGEIALMKSLGGTDHSIFVRQLAEGLILLVVATIPAIFIDWNLANSELNAWMNGTTIEGGRFINNSSYFLYFDCIDDCSRHLDSRT